MCVKCTHTRTGRNVKISPRETLFIHKMKTSKTVNNNKRTEIITAVAIRRGCARARVCVNEKENKDKKKKINKRKRGKRRKKDVIVTMVTHYI